MQSLDTIELLLQSVPVVSKTMLVTRLKQKSSKLVTKNDQ
jgi:hypothetical protein